MKTTCKQVERKDRHGNTIAQYWVVKAGSVEVKIYEGEIRGVPNFTVAYFRNGKRQRDNRATFETARAWAEQVAQDIANGHADSVDITPDDRAIYSQAIAAVAGTPLNVVALEWADAKRKLGGRSLAEAVDYFVARHPVGIAAKSVAEVKDEFIAAKKADGLSEVYLKDLRVRLGVFAEAFQRPISSVTGEAVSAWLRSLDVSGRSRNNYRNAVRSLMSYAAGLKMVPKDHIDWDVVALAKEEQTEIEIFTPEELKKILAAAQWEGENVDKFTNGRYQEAQGLLPWVVLGAFAGMRTAEIVRQRWDDINLERGYIRVTEVKGNTAQKRLIPIKDNLKQWLAVCKRDESGLCCSYGRIEDAIARLAERAGIEWAHNGLRHSYISYRVAETQDVAKTALEAGNSVAMIHKHYRELVTPDDAKAWFGIVPEHSRTPAADVV